METYNLAAITKKIYDSGLQFLTLATLRDIAGVKKESTMFNLVKRLLRNGILVKLEKNKYLLKDTKIHDFTLANLLYQPSYISFETALNFYGILSQFPYEIASATQKKTIKKIINDKTFTYIHLKRNLFWGYEKKTDFLIAMPEKALLDQIYLASKGLRNLSLEEYDFSRIKLSKFKDYFKKYPRTRQFNKITNSLKEHLDL